MQLRLLEHEEQLGLLGSCAAVAGTDCSSSVAYHRLTSMAFRSRIALVDTVAYTVVEDIGMDCTFMDIPSASSCTVDA